MKTTKTRIARHNRGIAVLFTLGFLILLTVIAVGFAANALVSRKIASNNVTRVQTDFLMDSAIARITSELQFIYDYPDSNAVKERNWVDDGHGNYVAAYNNYYFPYYTSKYMGGINANSNAPNPYNPFDIYGGFYYSANRTLSQFFHDVDDNISNDDFEVNKELPLVDSADNYDISKHPVWYLFRAPEFIDVYGDHTVGSRSDSGRRIIGRYAYANGAPRAPKWEVEYVYRKSDMPHTGRVGKSAAEIFYAEAGDVTNSASQEFWPFIEGYAITTEFPRILNKNEKAWGSFNNMRYIASGVETRYNSEQILKLKKFIRLNPFADPEAYWIKESESSENDKKEEMYKRFNLARTDWENLTVDDLLNDPEHFYVKANVNGVDRWVIDQAQTNSLPFLRVIANDPATFYYGSAHESVVTYAEGLANRRKQIAANLIDYNRKLGDPGTGHVTSDVTSSWISDPVGMTAPTYTGIKKTPMIDSFGMLATVDFYEDDSVGINDGKAYLSRERSLPLAGEDSKLEFFFKQGFIGNLVSMYELAPDKDFLLLLVLGGTNASGEIEITYKLTKSDGSGGTVSTERKHTVNFTCGDSGTPVCVGFNKSMSSAANPFDSGVANTSGFASLFSTSTYQGGMNENGLRKKLELNFSGFDLAGSYEKLEITAARISKLTVNFKPRRAILQYNQSNADFANFEYRTNNPITLTGKFPVERIAANGTTSQTTEEAGFTEENKSGYILGGNVPDNDKFAQRTLIYGSMFCFDPRQNLNPDDWSFVRVRKNSASDNFQYWQEYTFGKWYISNASTDIDQLKHGSTVNLANNNNNYYSSLIRLCNIARKSTSDRVDPFKGGFKQSATSPTHPGFIFSDAATSGSVQRMKYRHPYHSPDRRSGQIATGNYLDSKDYIPLSTLTRYSTTNPIPSAFHRSGVDEDGNDSGMVSPMELAFIHRGAMWETLNISNASTLQNKDDAFVSRKSPIRPYDMMVNDSGYRFRRITDTMGTNYRGGDGGILDQIKMTDDFESYGKLDINSIDTDTDGNVEPSSDDSIVSKRSSGNFVYSMFFKSIKKNLVEVPFLQTFEPFELSRIATQEVNSTANLDNLFISVNELKELVATMNSTDYPGNNRSNTNIVDMDRAESAYLKNGKFESRAQILFRPPNGSGIPAPNGYYTFYQSPAASSGSSATYPATGFKMSDKVKESFFVGKTINLLRTETPDELTFLVVVQAINDTGLTPNFYEDNTATGSIDQVYNINTEGLNITKKFLNANKTSTVDFDFNNLVLGTWANKESNFDSTSGKKSNYTKAQESYTAFGIASEHKEIVTFAQDENGKYFVKERKRIY